MKPPRVADFDQEALQQLHSKGLIWMEVPVELDDRFVIPPLEVSVMACLLFMVRVESGFT
jgi:hypothetical protein